ncbi:hypothetical protein Nepgr_007951 [Nepenthes gracilis]|uniref:Uncharacterized protein n=1 Tax=Nepenthes gracilis TaxID=150966 RepID=A0AAD3S8Q8_NEPGR|nr:hypothetical protein Nepgr_007951 [Nepenthes gracilis]
MRLAFLFDAGEWRLLLLQGWPQHVPISSAGVILYSWDPHLPPPSDLVRDSIMVMKSSQGDVVMAHWPFLRFVRERAFRGAAGFFLMGYNLILG